MIDEIIQKFRSFRSKWQEFLKKHHEWYMDHVRQRKLIIFGVLVTSMIGLLIGTRFVPSKSRFQDTPIGTGLSFGKNNNSTISMDSRKYNTNQKFMVIKFTVKSDGSHPIDPKYVSFKAVTLEGQDTKYQVLPLANSQYILLLSNLSKGYKAIQIKAINHQPSVDNSTMDTEAALDVTDSSSSSSSESTKNDPVTKDGVNFVINEDNKFIDNKLVKLSQKDYAVQSLTQSIKILNKRIDKQYANIESFQKQIVADKNAIQAAEKDRQYQVDQSDTDNQIASAKADIKFQESSIKQSRKLINTLNDQIDLYRKQIMDVELGKYKFKKPVSADSLR